MKSYVKISVLSKIFLVIPNLTNIIFHFKVSDYLYSTIQINENIVVLVLWVNDEWLQSFLYTVWFDLLLLGIQNKCQTNSYSCTEEKKTRKSDFFTLSAKEQAARMLMTDNKESDKVMFICLNMLQIQMHPHQEIHPLPTKSCKSLHIKRYKSRLTFQRIKYYVECF